MAKAAAVVSNLTLALIDQSADTLYASWTFTKKNIDKFSIEWVYYVRGVENGFTSGKSDLNSGIKTATFQVPENAIKVKFSVKPIAKKKKKKSYWSSSWSSATWTRATVATKPSAPNIEVDKTKLTASVSNLATGIDEVKFEIVSDNSKVFKTTSWIKLTTSYASFSCDVVTGHTYKARCKTRGPAYSESQWSDYSSDSTLFPTPVSGITSIEALSSTSVKLTWPAVVGAESYEIEHATELRNFDAGNVTNNTSEVATKIIDGLETGNTYYFRIRSVKDSYKSAWYPINVNNQSEKISITLGRPPAAPTTYSLVNTVRLGSPVELYWVHNAQDNSTQVSGEVELTFSGSNIQTKKQRVTVINENYTDEFKKNDNLHYDIDTNQPYHGVDIYGEEFTLSFTDGMTINWRVRTKGITQEYGEWSVVRKIDIVAPPVLSLVMPSIVETLPVDISLSSGPSNQTPIGYYIEIIAKDGYITEDRTGEDVVVNSGDTIFSNYFNDDRRSTTKTLTAGDISLESGQTYTAKASVSMNSGLTAEDSFEFSVDWEDVDIYPNAEIGINLDNFTATIMPYCEDVFDEDEGEANLVDGVTLSIFRQNNDGEFVEIASGIANDKATSIIDPHPTLGWVRYRIAATVESTGQIVYYDMPPEEVDQPGIVITWDQTRDYVPDDDELEDYYSDRDRVSGSILTLPYNVDTSENHSVDVTLMNYIGRKHSVGYYGTYVETTATWSSDVPVDDEETMTMIRRLAAYPGDVYVRESKSGVGYWANVKVSFNNNHNTLVIPVSLNITRVEGGI